MTGRITCLLMAVFLCVSIAHADYNSEYYEGDWSLLPDFDSLTPVATGTVPGFDISLRLRDSQYGFRFTGSIQVISDDTYTFYTNSDDGSQLFIDGALVVDNDGLHPPEQASGQIALVSGSYDITVTFFEQGGGEVLGVSWSNTDNVQHGGSPHVHGDGDIPGDDVRGEPGGHDRPERPEQPRYVDAGDQPGLRKMSNSMW